ncbi:MAG: leucine-rich repeat protein [Carboxylicivirga sp.]|jgi:hypothetical protein|nr:leucine-rich repeat protein [Carboxylicivirga sp.]
MKQFYLLTLFLICSLFVKGQYTLTIDDVEFNTSTGTITKFTNTTQKNIVIPDHFNGVDVKAINGSTFSNKGLTHVVLPSGLVSIGGWAFRYNQLQNLTIPSSVADIGAMAFAYNELTSVEFEDNSNIRWIKGMAFDENEGLSGIKLPSHQSTSFVAYTDFNGDRYQPGESINDFERIYVARVPYTLTLADVDFDANKGIINSYTNTSEKDIIIPEKLDGVKVEAINKYVFYRKDLIHVEFPAGITSIGEIAFQGNYLTEVDIPESLTKIERSVFRDNRIKTLTIPSSVVSIEETAFDDNHLNSVVFEENSHIRHIIGNAFANNNELAGVVLPVHAAVNFVNYYDLKGKTYDAGDAIDDFTITYAAKTPYLLTESDVDFDASTGTINELKNNIEKDIVIPDNFNGVAVVAIKDYSLDGIGLTGLSLPGSLVAIGERAFSNNVITHSVTIPKSVAAIGWGAFEDNNLSNVTFEDDSNIRIIGQSTFNDNAHLSSIVLPSHSAPTFIEYRDNSDNIYSQGGVINDLSKTYYAKVPYVVQLNDISYTINEDELTITKFNNKVEKYIEIPSTMQVDDKVVNVAHINEDAFDYIYLASVTLSDGLKSIGRSAFHRNYLRSIVIPNTVETMANHAFQMCDLESVTISNSLTTLETHVFGYNRLTKVIIPESVTTIGDGAFAYNQINSVVIPGSVTNIVRTAFNSNKLTEITIPNSVTNIGEKAFSYNNLTSVQLGNSLTFIDEKAFANNYKLSQVTLPADIIGLKNEIWKDANDKEVLAIEDFNLSYSVTGDITPVHLITFVDFDDSIIEVVRVDDGSTGIAPAGPQREGFRFTGWDTTFNNVTSDITVKAQYIAIHKVTFNNWDGSFISEELVEHGSAATAPANPTRVGHYFDGWNKSFSNVTEDITVTATYYIHLSRVLFEDWDGTELKTQVVPYGSGAEAPANPTREYHKFTGWSIAFDHVTEDLIVTAQYTINTYRVNFVDWDGATIVRLIVDHGSSVFAPDSPSRTGYTFIGWDVAFDNIVAPLVVTAQYKINSYSVRFEDWDGSELKSETVNFGSSATAPTNPSRTGFTFIGWDLDFDNVTSDLVITAQYDIANSINKADKEQFRIYPNPAVVSFTIADAEGNTIEIYNAAGILVKRLQNISNKQTISVNSWPKGVYMVKAGKEVRRIVIR